MQKLIIFFEQGPSTDDFQINWQKFMRLAEKMPGLRRQVVSDIDRRLLGKPSSTFPRIHEFLFDNRSSLDEALRSPAGKEAIRYLQLFTKDKVTLLTASHMEAQDEDFRRTVRNSVENK